MSWRSNVVRFAPKRAWLTKFERRSPRYTMQVDELPTVRSRTSGIS